MNRARDSAWQSRRANWTLGMMSLLAVPAQSLPAPPQYQVEIISHDCPSPFPDSPTLAQGINSSTGAVCGYYFDCFLSAVDHAFIWPLGGELQLIPFGPGVSSSRAYDINDRSEAVGEHTIQGNEFGTLAFLYSGGRIINLGTLPGGNYSVAHAINNNGVIVGYWGNNLVGDPLHAFVVKEGHMADLGTELGGRASIAYDISESGLVTGWLGNSPATDARAFIWNGSSVQLLPPIPGGTTSIGFSINDSGDVVGYGRIGPSGVGGAWRAFAWIDGTMIDLGSWFPGEYSAAAGVNALRQIVGVARPGGVVWHCGTMIPLTDLIPQEAGLTITGASSINEAGWITGTAMTAAGENVAVRLIPSSVLADLDLDGSVAHADLALLLSSWGRCGMIDDCDADLDCTQVVNGFDLAILLGQWDSRP